MYNKSQLSKDQKAAKEPKKLKRPVDKTVIPGAPKVDPNGYWDPANVGRTIEVPLDPNSRSITMSYPDGTPLDQPLIGVGTDTGMVQYMMPGQDYIFPFDKSVVEDSIMENGGQYMDLDEDEIAAYRAGGYVVEELPKAQVGYASAPPPRPITDLPEITVKPKSLGHLVDKRPEYAKGYYDPWGVPDNTLENIVEIFDPSGLSSWDDVARSYRKSGMSPETALEVFGAIPLLGKLGKLTKEGIHLAKYKGLDKMLYDVLPKNKSVSNALSKIATVGRATDIYQAYDEGLKRNGGVYSQDIPYPPKHNPANSFAVNDPRSMAEGGPTDPPSWNRVKLSSERMNEIKAIHGQDVFNNYNPENLLFYALNKDAINNASDFTPFIDPLNTNVDKKRFADPRNTANIKNKLGKAGWALDTKSGTMLYMPPELVEAYLQEPEPIALKPRTTIELPPVQSIGNQVTPETWTKRYNSSTGKWTTIPNASVQENEATKAAEEWRLQNPQYNKSTHSLGQHPAVSFEDGGELPKAQLGLIKSPFNLPADVKHPMQLPSKKLVKKPTRTYDPLVDNKPQKSETTQKTAAYSENVGEQQLRGAELRERAAKMMAEKDAQKTGIDYNTALANATKAVQSSDFNPGEYIQKEYKKDIGSGPASETVVKESTAPQSYASRAWDIVTNPQAAFEYAVRTGDFRNMPHNYNDMLMAGIDPSAGQGSNLVGDALNSTLNLFDAGDKVVRNVGEGNYLNAAMQGLRFLPSNGLVGNVLGRERGLLGATKYYKPAAISKEQALANLANEYKVNRYFDAVDDPGSYFGNLQSSDALPVNLFNNSIADVIKYKQLSKAVQKGIDPQTGILNAEFRFNDYPVLRQEWAKRVANEQGLPLNLNYENKLGQGSFGSVYPTTIDENLLVKIGEEPGHETLQSLQSLVDLGKEYSDKSHIALPLSTVKIKNPMGPELRTLKVMNRVPGEPGVPLYPSRQAVEQFISDVEDLQSKGVSYDFMNPQNMMYDPTTDRFSLIDLGTKHPDPNSRWATAISHDTPGAARQVMQAKYPWMYPQFDQNYLSKQALRNQSVPELKPIGTKEMNELIINMKDFDFQKGGAVMDLTPEQIKLYKDAGYVVMEEGGSYVDNQLTHFQKAGTVPLWYKENQINPSAFVSGFRGGEEPNTYKYAFLDNAGPGQLIGGAGLGIPKYGVDASFTGIVPTSPEEMQYFKGVYGANLSKQFKDVNLGLGVNTAITGYPGEKGFVRDPMSFEPSVSLKYNFKKDGGRTLDPGNNALELHMFYDKTKFQKGGKTFQPGQIYTFDDNPNVYYKLNDSGNVVVKNKQAGSNQYVAMNDPEGTRRKTLEYGLTTGKTNLYGTPEQYAEYSNKNSAINDFFFSENEAAKQLHQSNAEQCLKDSPNCLSSTWLYYDRHLAPNLGLPSSWQLKENAGIYSGPKETNSAFPKYGESADSWDIARAIIEGQGKSYYAAKDDAGVAYPTKKFWKDLNLPVGAIINAGSKGGGLKYGKGDTYNEGAGLVPSNHSAMVVGYDAEGIPYIYDYGKILKATDPNALVNGMGITNITAPKELTEQTYSNLKKQNKLKDEITDLSFNIPDVALNQISDIDEYKPFLKNLESNKSEIMSALGISNKTYDEYAKRAAAIALTETGGGNDESIRWKGIIPVPSYITDKIGFGSSQGITQINTDVLFSSDKTKKQMNALGITKDNYDPYNSKHIAAATMIMLADADKVAMANLKKHSSNKQDLNPAAATYYQWNSPSTLVKGEAQGDNINVKRFMQNYNMINSTFKQDGGSTKYLTQKEIDDLRTQGYYVIED